MPVERIPGERMYIDWVGDQPELLLDPATGEVKKVHVFATTLGFSSCVYAEIFLNEKLTSFISGVVHALSFYGAVPKYLVPDNLKSAISKHSKDELVLNSVFSDLEDFYDTVVLPPPPRKPKVNTPGWNRQFDRARPTPLPLKSYTLSASPTPSV